MRILHTADLHLGRQFHGISLELDHVAVLDQMVSALVEHQADVFIIAGDIFDRASPPATAVRQFNEFIRRVANETTAAVVLIAGNHDSGDRIGAMSVMTDDRRALIRGPLAEEEYPLILYDRDGSVAFSALPFGYEFAARECFADEGISNPEDVMRAQIQAAKKHVPENARWVVVAHGFIAGGGESESERPLTRVGGIETVPISVFEGANYVALGHLHKPQNIDAERIRYAGSPLAFGFDESDDEKSMTLVDLSADGSVKTKIIPLTPVRSVRTLRGKLADLLEVPSSEDFIKIVLTDEGQMIDAMKRVREVFPNAAQLTYDRLERAPEVNSLDGFVPALDDPRNVISSFLEHVRDQGPSKHENGLIEAVLSDIHEREALK